MEVDQLKFIQSFKWVFFYLSLIWVCMFYYRNSIITIRKRNPDSFIDSFMANVTQQLQTFNCSTELENNVIRFSRLVKVLPIPGQSRYESLMLLREGYINIEKMSSLRIKIVWSVKLDSLFAFSIIVGLVAGLFGWFASLSFVIFLAVAIFFPSIPYFIGYYLIKEKIDAIVYNSLEHNSNK